jgi:transcriptional regulator with XRE-family HTH domain
MDYELASRELFRALRGPRSQRACNRRLGYSSNVTHAWETGSRQPSMNDLFRMAELAKVDLVAALESLVRNPELRLSRAGDGIDGAAWLRELMVGWSVSEMARELGCNRNTVARWLRGQTEPRVAELLQLVQLTTQRLLDFVARLVAIERVPALAAQYDALERQRRIAYDMPWAHAVLHVLELEAYRRLPRHEPGFIARLLGISVETERAALDALLGARQIRRSRGRFRPTQVLSVDTSRDPAANLQLKAHWARVGSERLSETALARGALFSHNVFAVSDEGYRQIHRAHLEYYDRLRSIVAEHSAPTRIVLANVQLVPLDIAAGSAE